MRPAIGFALASMPGVAAAALHLGAMRILDRWAGNEAEMALGDRIWLTADNWVIRLGPFVVLTGFVLSMAVVIPLSYRLARGRSPGILVAESRAWALVTLVLAGLGAGLLTRPGIAFYWFHLELTVSWIVFIAWVICCVHVVAILRQLRPDLRFFGVPLAGYALYVALTGLGPLIVIVAAPFIARWRSGVPPLEEEYRLS